MHGRMGENLHKTLPKCHDFTCSLITKNRSNVSTICHCNLPTWHLPVAMWFLSLVPLPQKFLFYIFLFLHIQFAWLQRIWPNPFAALILNHFDCISKRKPKLSKVGRVGKNRIKKSHNPKSIYKGEWVWEKKVSSLSLYYNLQHARNWRLKGWWLWVSTKNCAVYKCVP